MVLLVIFPFVADVNRYDECLFSISENTQHWMWSGQEKMGTSFEIYKIMLETQFFLFKTSLKLWELMELQKLRAQTFHNLMNLGIWISPIQPEANQFDW